MEVTEGLRLEGQSGGDAPTTAQRVPQETEMLPMGASQGAPGGGDDSGKCPFPSLSCPEAENTNMLFNYYLKLC